VLVVIEVHVDVFVVPVADYLLLVDDCEVYEVTIVADGLMEDLRWRPGRPAASARHDVWRSRMSRRTCA
jgi:hypothetical protein